MGEPITFADGKVIVPNEPIIPFIEGDGIGPEVTSATMSILDAAIAKVYPNKRIHWKRVLAGQRAFEEVGEWLPQATIQELDTYLVSIKGPLATPTGGGIRSINVAIRQKLDLYVCLRPVRWFRGVGSPLRHPEHVNMTVFRENTEDIYAGIEWMQGTPEAKRFGSFLEEMGVTAVRFPSSSSYGVKPVSVEGSERLVRASIEYAIKHHLPSVTLVHKGNIMKFTEGGFVTWGYALAERDFGSQVFTMRQYTEIQQLEGKASAEAALVQAQSEAKIIIKDCIADAFLQNTLLYPQDYSVIATLNLNGDYISDQLAAMVGGIGIAPGANINYNSGHAVFEATHGTAPNIAGLGKSNPCSLLLSGVMLCDYLGWNEVGELIYAALEKLFAKGEATEDLTRLMDTSKTLTNKEFTNAIIAAL